MEGRYEQKLKERIQYDPSLCWDCANATRPWRCPWVSKFQDVPGWVARKTTVRGTPPYKSRKVNACPLFERDAYCGGLTVDVCNQRKAIIDESDTRWIAEAIVERAVEDWRELECGNKAAVYSSDGKRVKRDEVVDFFHSKWCAVLLQSFTRYTPAQIRKFIGVESRKFYKDREQEEVERSRQETTA